MANAKGGKSLDDMLQADRKKRKAEALAQEIFGKNRRQSAPLTGRSTPTPGQTLASRMGITKQQRSSSSSSIHRDRPAGKTQPPASLSRAVTAHRLETAFNGNTDVSNQFTARAPSKPKTARPSNGEISIRGAAGPYTVVAQNFAPGTTAADIESVFQPLGGDVKSCKLIASNPTVIAETVFLDKAGAEKVIATFNNKKADGRVLYVYMKGHSGAVATSEPPPAPIAPVVAPAEVSMEVDEPVQDVSGYQEERQRENDARARRDERPQDRGIRDHGSYAYDRNDGQRAQPSYQDGRYGFSGSNGGRWEQSRPSDWGRNDGRLYSDRVGRRGDYRAGGNGRW